MKSIADRIAVSGLLRYADTSYGQPILQPLQKSHISNLAKNLNSSSQISSILRLRLRQLQQMLWIPYNPTSLRDWSPWMKLMSFKKDFLANTLHSASLINIFFSPEHSNSEYTIANGSLPLLDIQSDLYIVTPHIVTPYKIPLYNHAFGKNQLI